jgi:hypothetical protein
LKRFQNAAGAKLVQRRDDLRLKVSDLGKETLMNPRYDHRYRMLLPILIVVGMLIGSAAATPSATNSIYLPLVRGPAHLLAADQAVGGQSLTDAALITAQFNASGDPGRYPPGLPYQILNTSGDNTFMVQSDTYFYIPIAFVNDSPPILGNFPNSADEAKLYFFDPAQIGAHDCFIDVDGTRYAIGPAYLAGPVTTAPLPDGGGTHYMVLAAFMRPLPPGNHTVSMGATFDGAAVLEAYGEPAEFVVTYEVNVTEP